MDRDCGEAIARWNDECFGFGSMDELQSGLSALRGESDVQRLFITIFTVLVRCVCKLRFVASLG